MTFYRILYLWSPVAFFVLLGLVSGIANGSFLNGLQAFGAVLGLWFFGGYCWSMYDRALKEERERAEEKWRADSSLCYDPKPRKR